MIYIQLLFLWCLLLPFQAKAFDLNLGGNVGGFDNVRFFFEFGLEEGVTVGIDDVHALLCRTQDYLGDVLDKEFPDQAMEVKATGIEWENNNDDPLPVKVSFTATLSGINGTELDSTPSPNDLLEATTGLDMEAYLRDTVNVSPCPTVFSQATQVEYTNSLVPDIEGSIAEPQCETTCAPTLTPGTPTIAPQPTIYPTEKPVTMSDVSKETFLTDGHADDQMRPDRTRNPSATNPPVSAVNPTHLPPAHVSPAAGGGQTSGGNNGDTGSGGSANSGNSGGGSSGTSSGGTTASGGSSPGGTPSGNQMTGTSLDSTMGSGSGSGSSSGPGAGTSSGGSSGNSAMSAGGSSSGQGGGNSGNSAGSSGESGFGIGGTSSSAGSTTSGGPMPIPSDSTSPGSSPAAGPDPSAGSPSNSNPFGADSPSSSASDSDTPGSSPSGGDTSGAGSSGTGQLGNAASSSGASGFGMGEGTSLGEGSPPENEAQDDGGGASGSGPESEEAAGNASSNMGIDGDDPGSDTDSSSSGGEEPTLFTVLANPNHSDAETGPTDMILFTITLSFFEGKEGEPTPPEVKSLVCKTQDFFADELAKVTGDSQVSFEAIDIDWAYNEDGSDSFELQFAANAKHGSNMPVPENEVFQSLKVAQDDLQDYIVGYVWEVLAPEGQSESVFHNVEEVDLQTQQNVPIPIGQMPDGLEESCDAYLQSRTGEGEITERSMESSGPPSNAATGQDNLIYFTFDLHFMDGTEKEPSLTEIKSLVCYTQDFFSDKIQEYSGDPVSFIATHVDWAYNADGSKVFDMKFAATVFDARTQEPFPAKAVFEAAKVAKKDLQGLIPNYIWKTMPAEGQTESVFYNIEQVGLKAHTQQAASIPPGQLLHGVVEGCDAYQGVPSETPTVSPIISGTVTVPPATIAPITPAPATLAPITSPPISSSPVTSPPVSSPSSATQAPTAAASQRGSKISDQQNENAGGSSDLMVIFTLRIGFFKGEAKEPSDFETEGAVCAMYSFIQDDLNLAFGDGTEAIVYIIDGTYTNGVPKPVTVNVVVEAVHANGTQVDPYSLYRALQLDSSDLVTLMKKYLWKAPPMDNVFHEAAQMSFECHVGVPMESPVTSDPVECDDHGFTTTSSGMSREGEGIGGFGLRGIPEAGVANDDSSQQSPDGSASPPSGTPDLFDALAADSPPDAPDASAPSTSAEADLNALVAEMPPPPDSPSDALSRVSPNQGEKTTDELVLSYSMVIGFYDEKEEPSQEEIEGLMCQAKNYFTEYLSSHLQYPEMEVSITDIGWMFDEDCHTPLNVMFTVGASLENGTVISPSKVFQALKLGDDEILDLIENYVTKSHPEGSSFADVDQLIFEESIGAAIDLPEGTIAEAVCPEMVAPTPSPGQRKDPFSPLTPSEESPGLQPSPVLQASYSLTFGFYEGKAKEPEADEVEAMICQTNTYFEEKLKESTGDSGVEAYAVDICWSYTADCPGPVKVSFGMEASFADGEAVPPRDMFDALKITEGEMKVFLEEYVWQSSPTGENLFSHANQLGFEDYLGGPMPEGQIDKASCPESSGPAPGPGRPSSPEEPSGGGSNFESEFSASEPSPSEASPSEPSPSEPSPSEPSMPNRGNPFSIPTQPTSDQNDNSIEEMPTDATSENAILYHLEFDFKEETTLVEPTPEEIEELVCETSEFFKGELMMLANEGGECLEEVTLSKIDWTFAEDCPTAPVTVTFAAQAMFCGGESVPPEIIYESLKLGPEELQLYLEAYLWSLEGNIFSSVNAMGFEGKLHVEVRPGKIAEVTC